MIDYTNNNNNNADPRHIMTQIYYFYKAPIVKFYCHSVNTGNLSSLTAVVDMRSVSIVWSKENSKLQRSFQYLRQCSVTRYRHTLYTKYSWAPADH